MSTSQDERGGAGRKVLLTVAWLWVGLPFAYGVVELMRQAVQLFGG